MKTFLYSIAEAYIKNYLDEIDDFCFIFPNKRCCIFFEKFIHELSKKEIDNVVFPNTIDINSFIMKTTHSVELSKIELLFILYDCYKKLVGNESIVNFDSFAHWGEIAIDDFNDIDRALVDAKEILTNTTHFDQIKTDYLTPEQMEVVDKHFRNPLKGKNDHGDNMWMHYQGDNESEILHKFRTLWEVLPELYENFTQILSDRNVCYSGMAYRKIAEKGFLDSVKLRYSKYIFIGFNALSNSEQKLFDWMKIKGIGDFYWDSESPFITEYNIAGRFVKEYKNKYKSGFDIADINDNIPEAEIIGIPSNVGQTKFAATKVEELLKNDKEINTKVNTAIVLPEESLCTYLLRSFPPGTLSSKNTSDNSDDGLKINITMGYPMSNTPVTSLIKTVINLEHKARTTEKEGYSFFYTDILELLAHPLLRKFEPKLVDVLSYMTNNEHRYIIPRDEIIKRCGDDSIECYFPLFDDASKTFGTISDLLKRIESKVVDDVLLKSFIKKYRQSLFLLQDLCAKHEIFLNKDTLAQMMHKLASNETVNFEGMPLMGVQIMGVLETRALDFENVIILSMNEKIYPKKLFRKSLIPYELRQGYKITTPDVQESIFAYYFYRLLTRAKRVFFVYDSRSGEGKSEMSRYLYQIKNIFSKTFGNKLSEIQYTFDISQPKERLFEIPKINDTDKGKIVQKDDAILQQLRKYTTQPVDGNGQCLSASAINKYIACPLEFFLEYVSDFREENEALTYVDDAMYGTILHEAFQNFYEYYKDPKKIDIFNKDVLSNIDEKFIEHSLVASFKTNYYAVDNSKIPDPPSLTIEKDIPPEMQMLADIMKSFMIRAFKCEIDYLDKNEIKEYRYIASEYKFERPFKIDDSTAINIKGFIDRIDEVTFNDGTKAIRIVDYKTGSDKTEFAGIESLFVSKDNPKAIFQLFLYSTIFPDLIKSNKIEGLENYKNLRIIPLIYKIRTLAVTPIDYLKIKNGTKYIDVTDFLTTKDPNTSITLEDSFTDAFKSKMQELYDATVPFTQTSDSNHCDYCRFASICGKENKL